MLFRLIFIVVIIFGSLFWTIFFSIFLFLINILIPPWFVDHYFVWLFDHFFYIFENLFDLFIEHELTTGLFANWAIKLGVLCELVVLKIGLQIKALGMFTQWPPNWIINELFSQLIDWLYSNFVSIIFVFQLVNNLWSLNTFHLFFYLLKYFLNSQFFHQNHHHYISVVIIASIIILFCRYADATWLFISINVLTDQ